MSASKDKILRRQQIDSGADKRTLAKEKEEKEHRRLTVKYTIIAVVVVLLCAAVLLYNSALPSRTMTAADINGEKYSVAQMNYYYSAAYQSFYNSYYQYFAYGYGPFSTEQPLDEQIYSEEDGTTWHDYFLQTAADSMKEIQMLCTEAEAAGFTMPEDSQAEYDSACETLETQWQSYGYSSLGQFMNLVYGKGVSAELAEAEMYRSYLASAYAQSLYDGYEYTDEELAAYYDEHADEYDNIHYAYYLFNPTTYTTDDVTADDAAALVAGYAEDVAAAVNGTSADELNAYLSENYDGASSTENTYAGQSLSSVYAEWLLEDGREAGDASVFESGDSRYVVMFLGRDKNDYKMADFRHILIKAADADGDSAISDEEFQLAHDTAQGFYDEWLAGDADEDSFAELANLHSEDAGSNTTGGLYENVYKGEMVTPVNDWIFDAARAAGDCAVVDYNEGGSYSGTHVLYYAGQTDETYALNLADSASRSEAYTAWKDGRLAEYTVKTSNLGMCGDSY